MIPANTNTVDTKSENSSLLWYTFVRYRMNMLCFDSNYEAFCEILTHKIWGPVFLNVVKVIKHLQTMIMT